MGKGSVPRPFEVPREEFDNKWDAIFGKKNIKEEKKQQEDSKDEVPKDSAK